MTNRRSQMGWATCALGKSLSLATLDLYGNNLGDSGAQTLDAALAATSTHETVPRGSEHSSNLHHHSFQARGFSGLKRELKLGRVTMIRGD